VYTVLVPTRSNYSLSSLLSHQERSISSTESTEVFSAQQNAAKFTTKLRTVALVVVAIAFVMDLLDGTITNIAIPSIRANLSASYSSIQWVVAGYSLAFAVLLVTGGRMGDVFGYKKIFMIGVGGFTLASLLSGLSVTPEMLIFARLLQGSMAALMVPQVMSLMQVMYQPHERGSINGLFGALGGMAASLGPVIGGLLIKANIANLDWRPIFLINVPVGLFGLFAAAKYLPDGKSSHPLKLDLTGTAIIMAALLLLVFPLIQGRDLGWPTWTFTMMAASLVLFGAFAVWLRHKDKKDGSPLVLPSLFHSRSFNFGLLVNLTFESAMVGFFLTFGLFLQIGLGFTAIHAALTGLPVAIGIATTMAIMGPIIPRLGRRALYIGCTAMAVGLLITTWVLGHYGLSVHSWQLIPGLLFTGIGMGHIFGTLFSAVLNGVDPKHAGAASGTLNAVQQLGGAIGIALIGVVFFGSINQTAPASFDSVSASLSSTLSAEHVPAAYQTAIISGVKTCFVDRSTEKDSSIIPASCKTAETGPLAGNQTLTTAIGTTAAKANAANFTTAFRWATVFELCLLLVTFGLAFALPKRFRTDLTEA
jgi:EmrB/QacA subfamily drug resistance transporter